MSEAMSEAAMQAPKHAAVAAPVPVPCTMAAVAAEAWVLTRLAVPSSIANLNIGLSMAVIIIISPLGEDAIAGAGSDADFVVYIQCFRG